MILNKSQLARFMAKLDMSGACWIWTAGKDKDGYGKFMVGRQGWRSHRLAYVIFKGPILGNLCVLHSCDNPSCCNPSHLSLGTNQENTQQREDRGRGAKGSKIWLSKLTEDQVTEMRKIGGKCRDLAKQFGIGKSAANYILNRTTWNHI